MTVQNTAVPGAFTPRSPRRSHKLRAAIKQGAASAAVVDLLFTIARGEQAEHAFVCQPIPTWARPMMEAAHG